MGHTSPGPDAAGQIGRDRHDHGCAQRQLIRLYAHDLHGGFDGAAQIGPGCQLHTAGEGQRIDVEVALAHHLLQVGRHHAGIKVVVGRGDGDDGRLQLGVNQDFVQLLTQQHGHGCG